MRAPRSRLIIGLSGLFAALLSAAPAAAQGSGRIQGRVTEAETGRPLEGARVRLSESGLAGVTDQQGRYVITRVPAGTDTISVAYIGREPQAQLIAVRAGQTADVSFSLGVATVVLQELTALGVRAKTQAEALSRQQNAANISNIVASDQMGRFPDVSAPEAVQRLPGIAVQRDQGEGRYIQIRGGSAANTQVSFNGIQVPSPEGEQRQIALDAVPVDVLESIEVSKAITPDMDADAIGGAVNLVTRQAPEIPTLSAELSGGYGTIRGEPSYAGALTYGRRFADNRVGLMLSGSASRRDFGSDDLESEFDLGDPGPEDDALENIETRRYDLWRARIGATAALDLRAGENSTFTLTGIYSELQDDENRRNVIHEIADGELHFLHKTRYEAMRLFNLAFTGEHLLSNGFSLDYNASVARSGEKEDFDWESEFVQEGVTFAPDMSDPDNLQTNPTPGSVRDGTYVFDNIVTGGDETTNREYTGGANLTVPYRFGMQGSGRLRFGVKIRDKTKDQDVTEFENELADGSDDIVLGADVGGPFDFGDDYNPGDYEFPTNATSDDDMRRFPDAFGGSLEGELNVEENTNDYDLDERVVAAYAMTEIDVTPRLMILPGLRFERTSLATRGYQWDSEAETLTPVTADNAYSNVFPMLHARYRITPQTNLRAAFTTTIARPNFFDLVPYRVRDDEDLALGNPELEPTIGRNFDLLLEHYDQRIGVLSAGVFYKSLDKPIFLFTGDNEFGGETTQPRNVDDGRILGFELAVQKQLTMLPYPLDALGIWANYTLTDSDVTLPGGREARLAGQAKHVFNTALSYDRGAFSSQISLNYHDAYVLEFGGDVVDDFDPDTDLFVDKHLQLDFSGSYLITPSASVFLELVNLTNEPFRTYQGSEDRPRQQEFYESWGRIGFRISR
ncbi:MAG: TonB-dependent receptor [Gemmatimonadota bacterium]|nr:TonB-dependent receptor [Gemmatimonadota bacterium]